MFKNLTTTRYSNVYAKQSIFTEISYFIILSVKVILFFFFFRASFKIFPKSYLYGAKGGGGGECVDSYPAKYFSGHHHQMIGSGWLVDRWCLSQMLCIQQVKSSGDENDVSFPLHNQKHFYFKKFIDDPAL